jgi:hypothetical protein
MRLERALPAGRWGTVAVLSLAGRTIAPLALAATLACGKITAALAALRWDMYRRAEFLGVGEFGH